METIKECKLVELVLQGNPIKDRMHDDTVYVRYFFLIWLNENG